MFTQTIDSDLRLELVKPEFAPLYFSIIEQERNYLAEFLTWPKLAEDVDFFASFINQALVNYDKGDTLTCAIFYRNTLVGNISFNCINHALKKVEIGYWLRQSYQGKGIITRAATHLINHAFTTLNMEKVEIRAAVNNTASRKVCERLGFTLEGILTHAELVNGNILDHAIYGLLKPHQTEKY